MIITCYFVEVFYPYFCRWKNFVNFVIRKNKSWNKLWSFIHSLQQCCIAHHQLTSLSTSYHPSKWKCVCVHCPDSLCTSLFCTVFPKRRLLCVEDLGISCSVRSTFFFLMTKSPFFRIYTKVWCLIETTFSKIKVGSGEKGRKCYLQGIGGYIWHLWKKTTTNEQTKN